MIRTLIFAALLVMSAPVLAQDGSEDIMLPYPDRIQPLKAPVNVGLRYNSAKPRKFVTDIIWGPEKAPGLYRMRAMGALAVTPDGKSGPLMTIERGATQFTFGPKVIERGDKGKIMAEIAPLGGFRHLELHLPGLDTKAHREQFSMLGTSLIDTGRVPPFKRLEVRAGPDDTAGGTQVAREKQARIDILEAMQPMLGFVLDLPVGGLSTGSKLTLIRRDLGDLFRDAGPIPLRVEGRVMGLSEIDNRRFLTLKLENAEMTPPMRAIVDGYALIDIETAIPETVLATIELVIVNDAKTTVFKFVERRTLLPDPAGPTE